MKTAPIVIFTYNRPAHLMRTVEALKKNPLARQSELIIFSDGPRDSGDAPLVAKVHKIITRITGFHRVRVSIRSKNRGLSASIISGMNYVFRHYSKAIVLEDDLLTSQDFLDFMNRGLVMYENDKRIFSLTGYTPPIDLSYYDKDIFLTPRPGSWGWATWRDRWRKVDWKVKDFDMFIRSKAQRQVFNKGGLDSSVMLRDEIRRGIESWDVRFYYSCFKNKGLCIYPAKSKVSSTGTDGTGVHMGRTRKYDTHVHEHYCILPQDIAPDDRVMDDFAAFYRPSLLRRGINFLKLNT